MDNNKTDRSCQGLIRELHHVTTVHSCDWQLDQQIGWLIDWQFTDRFMQIDWWSFEPSHKFSVSCQGTKPTFITSPSTDYGPDCMRFLWFIMYKTSRSVFEFNLSLSLPGWFYPPSSLWSAILESKPPSEPTNCENQSSRCAFCRHVSGRIVVQTGQHA